MWPLEGLTASKMDSGFSGGLTVMCGHIAMARRRVQEGAQNVWLN